MTTYPGTIDTADGLHVPVNNWVTQLYSSITAGNVDIPVVDVTGLQPTFGMVSIDNEVILYEFIDTGGATPVLRNCTRGYDGTTATPHQEDAEVEVRWVAKHHNVLSGAIRAIEATVGEDPHSGFSDVAQRLDRMLPAIHSVASATTDWSFTHEKRRCVSIQCWKLETGGPYAGSYTLVTPDVLVQAINVSGTSTVTVTMPASYAGYIVYG